jgi:hypothetical protein
MNKFILAFAMFFTTSTFAQDLSKIVLVELLKNIEFITMIDEERNVLDDSLQLPALIANSLLAKVDGAKSDKNNSSAVIVNCNIEGGLNENYSTQRCVVAISASKSNRDDLDRPISESGVFFNLIINAKLNANGKPQVKIITQNVTANFGG